MWVGNIERLCQIMQIRANWHSKIRWLGVIRWPRYWPNSYQKTRNSSQTEFRQTEYRLRPGSHQRANFVYLYKHLICQQMMKNKCEPTLKILSNFLPIAKIPPMFKEAEVLPWRLRNFGKVDALGPPSSWQLSRCATSFASYPAINSNRLYQQHCINETQ